jgi:hypothetical protein
MWRQEVWRCEGVGVWECGVAWGWRMWSEEIYCCFECYGKADVCCLRNTQKVLNAHSGSGIYKVPLPIPVLFPFSSHSIPFPFPSHSLSLIIWATVFSQPLLRPTWSTKKKKTHKKIPQIPFEWNLKGFFCCSTILVVWDETSSKWQYRIRATLRAMAAQHSHNTHTTETEKIKKSKKWKNMFFLNFLYVSNRIRVRNGM